MNDLEISKALALAIGWKDHDVDPDVITIRGAYDIEPEIHCWHIGNWYRFDYRDWKVIAPIAERYDCFPKKNPFTGLWCAVYCDGEILIERIAGTPQKAIALAVIGAKK
jgi:hypothetical protein